MRTLNYSILGLAGFCATAFVLHSFLPLPEVAGITSKILFLAAHRGEYDTIFLGSSRVYHGINPATFDAAMADPNTQTIVLDVDSPGGSVQGTPELASRIFGARGQGKRLIAVASLLVMSQSLRSISLST